MMEIVVEEGILYSQILPLLGKSTAQVYGTGKGGQAQVPMHYS